MRKKKILLKNRNKNNSNTKKIKIPNRKKKIQQQRIFKYELDMLKKPFPISHIKLNEIVIPLHIYQTWYTKKELPIHMKKNIELIQIQNPEFEYHLFDDNECREFIKNHYDKFVLEAFDYLIPGAYKADLWRYCILYKYGGIYLDIKYRCTNGFKFIYLTDKEYFCTDFSEKTKGNIIDVKNSGIYNALLICKPGCEILKKCIDSIVYHVHIKYYGNSFLEPTGPLLLNKFFTEEEKTNMILNHYARKKHFCIRFGLFKILEFYPEYRNEQKKFSNKNHYSIYWFNKNMYL